MKILQTLILVAAIAMFVLVGAAAVLFSTGALTAKKMSVIAQVVREEKSGKTADADAVKVTEEKMEKQETSEEIVMARKRLKEDEEAWKKKKEASEAKLALEKKDLEALREDIETLKSEVDAQATELLKSPQKVGEETAHLKKAIQVMAEMKTTQILPLFQGKPDEDVVKYLRLMDASLAGKVLAGLGTEHDPDKSKRVELLLSRGGISNLTDEDLVWLFGVMPEHEAVAYINRLPLSQIDRVVVKMDPAKARWLGGLMVKREAS